MADTMTEFCTLASSSSGNCAFLKADGESFLIDAGISCRAIVNGLKLLNAQPNELNAVFITHEHSDHIKGLKVFLKNYKIPVYSTPEVLNYLAKNDLVPADAVLREMKDNRCDDFSAQIISFDTPHDSVHSVGYRIHTKSGAVGIATDLGYMSDEVRENLYGCKTILIESNYDRAMLECGSYPYYLKRRIMSDRGHLCNDDCAGQLYTFIENSAEHILLGHISRENNLPHLAYATAVQALSECGARENTDFTVVAAPASEMSPVYRF